MNPIIFALPGNEILTDILTQKLSVEQGQVVLRHFPDGETYVRFQQDIAGKEIILVCTLHAPDDKILPVYFLAETARELGAVKVGLIAPYLAYMRQDWRFHEGEGITSRYFSKWISKTFDWLVTVDPHLHRYHSLSEIYSIPNQVVHAAVCVARWIRDQIQNPLLIGPDSESIQWVADVAHKAQAPYIILQKQRHGDRNVEISVPHVEQWNKHTPVLVDDIISTGHTMSETIVHLRKAKMNAPVCIGVHGIFADQAYEHLLKAGAQKVVTSNTICHQSNQIDVSELIVTALPRLTKINT